MLKLCIYALLFVADLQMSRFWRNFVIISKTEIAVFLFLKKSSLLILHGWRVISLQSVVIICFLLFQCCVYWCYCSLCFPQDANIHFATLTFASFVWVCSCWQVDNYLKMLQLRSTVLYNVLESLNCLVLKSESDKELL